MTTQHFKLQNLSCSSCVMHLESMEDDLAGVKKVDVNFKKLTMQVEYSEDTITTEGITQAVSAMGYIATPETQANNNDKKGSPWNRLFRS